MLVPWPPSEAYCSPSGPVGIDEEAGRVEQFGLMSGLASAGQKAK